MSPSGDGTLVVVFDNLQGAGTGGNGFDIKVIRSTDRGPETGSGGPVCDNAAP